MKIARYWEKAMITGTGAHGQPLQATGWGWSPADPGEAKRRATETAHRVLSFLRQDGFVQQLHEYGYDERPPREEIVDEYSDRNGELTAIVTRNSYGALILNTRDLMFIDVDFPARKARLPLPRVVRRLLGQSDPPDVEDTLLAKIRQAARQHPQFGFRIYRTGNGFRVMLHTEPVASQSEQATALLDAFGADPLYRRLCKHQECFRARLTPKPFRCHLPNPPHRYPFQDPVQQAEYERWDVEYQRAAKGFNTCRYVETIGPPESAPPLVGLIEIHDQLTKAAAAGPLA